MWFSAHEALTDIYEVPRSIPSTLVKQLLEINMFSTGENLLKLFKDFNFA